MYDFLAYADISDSGATNLMTMLGGAVILAAVCGSVFVLILISRARHHRHPELMLLAAVFWGLVTAASLIYAQQSQMKWSKEYTQQLESGYLDPHDTADAPRLPWPLWTGLAVAYAAMLAWALSQKRPAPSEK